MFMWKQRYSFDPRHTDRIRSVQTAAQSEVTRAHVFTNSQKNYISPYKKDCCHLIMNINLHLHPNSSYYCQLNIIIAYIGVYKI